MEQIRLTAGAKPFRLLFPKTLLANRCVECKKMTKKEIVRQIADKLGLTQLKTKKIVQSTFDAIIETLLSEKRIELRNFGVFEVRERRARKARNPRTGERVFVPGRMVVSFKPGKVMESLIAKLPS